MEKEGKASAFEREIRANTKVDRECSGVPMVVLAVGKRRTPSSLVGFTSIIKP